MAEGGEEEGRENPFSFKKFVNNRERGESPASGDEDKDADEEFAELPDIGMDTTKERSRKKQLVVTEDEGPANKKADDNPFSFKKFLQNSNGTSGGARPKVMERRSPEGSGGGLATLDLASDLPDFVQDHFSGDHNTWRPRPVSDVPLPDFALDSNVRSSSNHDLHAQSANLEPNDLINNLPISGEGARPKHGHNHGQDGFQVPNHQRNGHLQGCEVEEEQGNAPGNVANSTGGLPDFLSDSAVNRDRGVGMEDDSHNNDVHYQNGDLHIELRQLREENRELRRKLDEARRFSTRESKRLADLLVEMAAIEKRESEETIALENMVQQVEANLVTTTKRAIAAENTVAKLKQDNKYLQTQLTTSRLENEALMSGKGGMEIVREKAKYASDQINLAASTAEQRLKELLSGIETLKLVSDVLASIDKVTEDGATGEMDTEDDHSGGAGGACGGATTSPT